MKLNENIKIGDNEVTLKEIVDKCNFNYELKALYSSGVAATTETISEIELLNLKLTEAGTYIFFANIPLNYYGQSGRELYLRLKVNGVEIWYSIGVCNTYVYTLSTTLFRIANISKNDIVTITIQDITGKTYACRGFDFFYMKIQ